MADEVFSPTDAVAQLSFAVLGMLERRAAQHDLSMAQVRLLGILRDRTPTMNELARLMELDKSSITGLVERAERRGLVLRVPSVTDRRSVLVRLTTVGREMVTQAARLFDADVAVLLGLLPARERDLLTGLVSRLLVAHAREHGVEELATATEAEPGTPASRR
jgi:MarR family transcriptional regulator, lower aerobic nicotinate degradation pathway regulator